MPHTDGPILANTEGGAWDASATPGPSGHECRNEPSSGFFPLCSLRKQHTCTTTVLPMAGEELKQEPHLV